MLPQDWERATSWRGRNKEAGDHYRWALENCEWNPILISNACNWLREQNYVKESLSLLSTGLQRWPNDLRLRWGMVLSLHHGKARGSTQTTGRIDR